MTPSRRLILGGALLLAGCGGVALLSDPVARYPVWLALVAVATVGWLLGLGAVRGAPDNRRTMAAVLGVGIAARALLLVPATPLSDDLYRYLWDGRVANAGLNPFQAAPVDPALESLRDDAVWPRINHPSVPTIYPPVAQLAFRAIDAVAPTPLGVRATFAFFDLVAVALLAVVLRARRWPATLAIIHAWCPLAIHESAGGGHVDSLGVALLVGGIAGGTRAAASRGFLRGFLVAASCCVKPVGVVLGPALLRSAESGRERLALLAGGAAVLVLFVPYLDAGAMVARGFLTYAEHWRFNDFAYTLVRAAGPDPDETRWILAAALSAFAIAAPFRWRDPLAAGGLAVGVLLLLSPTVHPWYVVWLVPLVPFLPRFARAAGLVLVTLAPISYAAAWGEALTGGWEEPTWSRAALWSPVLLALALGIAGRFRRSARAAAAAASER